MAKKSSKQNDAEKVAKLAKTCSLTAVRMTESASNLVIVDNVLPSTFSVILQSRAELSDGEIRSLIGVSLTGEADGSKSEVRIASKWELIYETTAKRVPEEILLAFGENVSVPDIFPYAREYVNSISMKMAIPQIVLPWYRKAAAEKPATKKSSRKKATRKRNSPTK